MTRIVLTEEQAKLLDPTEPVEICHPQGHVLAVIMPELTAEELAKIPRARDSQGPMVTSQQIRETLQALQEAWDHEGPFDKARALEIAKRIREGRGA